MWTFCLGESVWNIYFLLYLISAVFILQKNINDIITVVSMQSCDAIERSNNSYIESIVEPSVSQNQKGIFAMWVWLERKSWKRVEAMEKKYTTAKSGICVYVWEKKIAVLKFIQSF